MTPAMDPLSVGTAAASARATAGVGIRGESAPTPLSRRMAAGESIGAIADARKPRTLADMAAEADVYRALLASVPQPEY
jgi:hypothetical protein